MPIVAHVLRDIGCNKEVEDQRSQRFLNKPIVTLMPEVTSDCADIETQFMAAISPALAGAEALERLSTGLAAEPELGHHQRVHDNCLTLNSKGELNNG
jgi:hypothetical protein